MPFWILLRALACTSRSFCISRTAAGVDDDAMAWLLLLLPLLPPPPLLAAGFGVVGDVDAGLGFLRLCLTTDFFTWAETLMGFHGPERQVRLPFRGPPLRQIIGPCGLHLGPLPISFALRCSKSPLNELPPLKKKQKNELPRR